MKKLVATTLALSLFGSSAPALAHPTAIPFASFGDCNAALNQINHDERVRVGSFFPSNGAAEVSMLNNWQCVYDGGTDAWYMDGQPLGGDNLGNGNGKAAPGSGGN
jgi:hypothetical protein